MNIFQRRHDERRATLARGLKRIDESQAVLGAKGTEALQRVAAANFVTGEMSDLVQKFLGPEALGSSFSHIPGRRK